MTPIDDPHARDSELSEDAAHRLLARAVELDAGRASNFTIAQLREVAREAGISSRAFEDALALSSRAETADRWATRLAVNAAVLAVSWPALKYGSLLVSRLTHGSPVPVILSLITFPLLGAGVALRYRARLAAAVLGAVSIAQIVGFAALQLGVAPRTMPGTSLGWLALTLASLGGVAFGALIGIRKSGTFARERTYAVLPPAIEDASTDSRSTPSASTRRASLALRPAQALRPSRLGTVGALVLLAFITPTARAHAQQDIDESWSATAALAVGSAELTCNSCDGPRSNAPAGYLRIGRAITSHLTISGEFNMWKKSTEYVLTASNGAQSTGTTKFYISTVNAVAQWYPLSRAGFFVDGGVGLGRYHVSAKARNIPQLSAQSNALGYQAGVGYDIRVTEHLAITPFAKLFGFSGAKLQDVEGRTNANVRQAGVGLTWRMGDT